ncbi:polysaccharide biosynthesis/export family protein [Nostoc sp. DedQUE02]|uniref:polysaccharide biosynthesis/export family protein n=1 Tax=Nostoc sp. DedQUE02 TaxID=3075388 RepID=UPI002AD79E81|nr:polysaccharide biosynthesis/export family protein [Nostoc sp. DedQUE02]
MPVITYIIMRGFSALCFVSLQVGVFLTTPIQLVVAQQPFPFQGQSPGQPPSPVPGTEVVPPGTNNEISPQLSRYLLGPGDAIGVVLQRPPGPYRLGIGDGISVSVQRFPDLSFQALINPEGNIVVPLLGTVFLQGLTLQEAQEKIRLGLSRIVPDPIVVVSLVGTRPVQVTISGEIFRPGIYPINSTTPRVADALLISGGSTLNADLRQVQVRRKLIDGSVISQTIDLYAALQDGGSIPNLRLQDGDAILIPRREVGNDDGYDRNLVARSSLSTPQIRVRVLNYAAGGISTQALPNGSTFVDALGGVNLDTANLRDIALVRFDPEQGKAVTQKLDAKKALGGDASQNVALQDNDVIVVGRNLIGRITNLLTTITQPFFNVQSFLRFFDNFGGN